MESPLLNRAEAIQLYNLLELAAHGMDHGLGMCVSQIQTFLVEEHQLVSSQLVIDKDPLFP